MEGSEEQKLEPKEQPKDISKDQPKQEPVAETKESQVALEPAKQVKAPQADAQVKEVKESTPDALLPVLTKSSDKPAIIGFKYPECPKGGYHVGEALNMVCFEPKCIQKCVICCLCYEEEHKGHKVRPLKLVIQKSKKYLNSVKPLSFDSQKIKDSIHASQTDLMKQYTNFQKQVLQSLASIKDSIKAVHIKMLQQVDLKTGSNRQMFETIDALSTDNVQCEAFTKSMMKLMAGVPLDTEKDEEPAELTENDLTKTVEQLKKKFEGEFEKKTEAILDGLNKYIELLEKASEKQYLFSSQVEYQFSPDLHHSGVSIISDILAKSTEGYNYHFALMQPCLPSKKAQTVVFKIKQNTSSWLAVGICHKKTVVNNGYNFNYSSLGHGAYMISSNGGSWSSINSTFNNVVTAFAFYKDDLIIVHYDPIKSQVIFKKKGAQDSNTHKIDFEVKPDDELCLCALFYYANDEIEYQGQPDQVV